MRRILQVGPRGLFLIGVVVALAVLVLPGGGARPAAAQPDESDVGVEILGIVDATGDPPILKVRVGADAEDVDIVKRVVYTHMVPVGQAIHYQWFPPPYTAWHCDRAKVPPEPGLIVDCSVSARAPGAQGDENGAQSQAECDSPPQPVPLIYDWELSKCKKFVPDSTLVIVVDPTPPDVKNTCLIVEGPGGAGGYVISDCDLDFELYLPEEIIPADPVNQIQPWNLVAQDTEPGQHTVTETVRIDPEPPTTDPDDSNNESEITYVIDASAVGGIADLPPVAETSAEGSAAAADGSGWSAGAFAALAGGLAAALMAFGGGAWYARRRFSRS